MSGKKFQQLLTLPEKDQRAVIRLVNSLVASRAAIKRRAQALINNHSIDPETRSILRYGLEIDDPSLAGLVRRVDDGENIVDNLNLSPTGEENSLNKGLQPWSRSSAAPIRNPARKRRPYSS